MTYIVSKTICNFLVLFMFINFESESSENGIFQLFSTKNFYPAPLTTMSSLQSTLRLIWYISLRSTCPVFILSFSIPCDIDWFLMCTLNCFHLFSVCSGIFAYINYLVPKQRKAILETLVNGLKRLEYRGYDSAGKYTSL